MRKNASASDPFARVSEKTKTSVQAYVAVKPCMTLDEPPQQEKKVIVFIHVLQNAHLISLRIICHKN